VAAQHRGPAGCGNRGAALANQQLVIEKAQGAGQPIPEPQAALILRRSPTATSPPRRPTIPMATRNAFSPTRVCGYIDPTATSSKEGTVGFRGTTARRRSMATSKTSLPWGGATRPVRVLVLPLEGDLRFRRLSNVILIREWSRLLLV
jgi:hypothetical protein